MSVTQAVAQRPGVEPETVCLQGHGSEAHTLDSKILETFALNHVPPFPGPCTPWGCSTTLLEGCILLQMWGTLEGLFSSFPLECNLGS